MTEQPTHQAVVSKEDRKWIAGRKTSDGMAAPE
jgi:hypothetical protein